jgi:3D (Asp-Asp-Asp) domain-containing protein
MDYYESMEKRQQRSFFGFLIGLVLVIFLIFIFTFCFSTSLNGDEENWKSKRITVIATAYCLCIECCGKSKHDGKTASGGNAYQPGIAVDPKLIPYGSRIDCPLYTRKPTWAEADDCGGSIKKNRIDLRMENHEDAKKFGKQEITIRIWIREN